MDIKFLQEFVEFSKSLNINTAARSMFMSPSGLSKHLNIIESEIGVSLIDRSSNSLKLTEAGRSFLQAASRINHIYETAIEECGILSQNSQKVRFLKPCTIDASMELVYAICRNMQKQNPNVKVELVSMGNNDALENLTLGNVDCATIHACNPKQLDEFDKKGIVYFPLFEDNIYVWMPSSHRLASKDSVSIKSLSNVPIYVPASRIYDDLHNWTRALCSYANFKPMMVFKDVADMYELMNLALDDGVIILTSEAIMGDPVIGLQNSMTLRPISDEGVCNTVYLGVMADNQNPAIDILLDNICLNTYPKLEDRGIRDIIERR